MTSFNVIVALTERHRGIGAEGRLPWELRGELARFARLTKGAGNNAVIMGRKTWESLPRAPLVGRHNIVLSRAHFDASGAVTKTSVAEAIEYCVSSKFDEAWVIGGAQVYDAFADVTLDRAEVTYVQHPFHCDTFMSPRLLDNLEATMALISVEECAVDGVEWTYRSYARPRTPGCQ
jgi:dihydrofolate reductase